MRRSMVRVYGDLFFLLNAVVDAALLAIAARLAGVPYRPWRLAAGAAFGGAYGLAALVVPAGWAFGPLGVAGAALAMAGLTFAPVPLRVLIRLVLALFGGAALLGGVVELLQGASSVAGEPWWVLALALGACLCAAAFLWERWRPRAARWLCDLEVRLGDRRAFCRALVDTGNGLRDPVSGGPAVLMDRGALRALLPPDVLASVCGDLSAWPEVFGEVAAAAEPAAWAHRLSIIPFRAVGTERGLLCGLRPDAVRLRMSGAWIPVRAVIGCSPQPLDPDAGYHALVPACLVTGDAGRH